MAVRLGGPVFRWENDPELFALRHEEKGYRAASCPGFLTAGDTDTNCRYVQALKNRDIVIAEVGAWCNPLAADRKEAEKNIAYMTERLFLAEEIGAKTCVNVVGSAGEATWFGPHFNNYSADFFALAVETARRILDAVHPRRTTLSFEIMPYCFLDGPEEYLRLLKAIDRKGTAVHFDPCNCVNSPRLYYHMREFLENAFRLLGPQMISLHCKDIRLKPEPVTVMFEEVPIGQGNMDYVTLLQHANLLADDTPMMLEHLEGENAYDAAALTLRSYAERAGVTI